jgi:16S rRNA (uracil1498-N3)-methyltransferase
MARRYLVDPLPAPGPAALPRDTSHHVGRVMRARPGEELVLFDGRGRECRATVSRVRDGAVWVDAEAAAAVWREPRVHLELAFGLPSDRRAEWLFEHATEVGAAVLRPLCGARSQPRGAARVDRWQRIAAAAAAQCDRSRVPRVCPTEDLGTMLGRDELPAERYLAQPGAPPLGSARTDRALLVVGPPGGFAAAELELAAAAGLLARGLGALTLRTETAALVGAAALLAG